MSSDQQDQNGSHEEYIYSVRKALYQLYYIENIHSEELFSPSFADYFKQRHTGGEIAKMMQALEWALQNKEYNFTQLLPDLGFSNVEILVYIEKLLAQMKASFDAETLKDLQAPEDSRQLRILVVQDQPMNYGPIEAHLSSTPYETTSASDIQRALEAVSGGGFDLVIVSLHNNPTVSLDFIKEVRRAEKDGGENPIPIIVLTKEDDDAGYINLLYQAGCSFHLKLPVVIGYLLQAIYRYGGQ